MYFILWQETYFEEDMKRVAVPLRETEAVKVCSYFLPFSDYLLDTLLQHWQWLSFTAV